MMGEDFWKKVEIKNFSECWEWLGYRNKNKYGESTYGVTRFNGKNVRAHRLAYILTYGSIPKGMFVCHTCDNPPCCNPAHLWIGTHQDNVDDREKKGRGVRTCGKRSGINYAKGRNHGNAVLSESDIPNIRSDNRTHVAIASSYGVHPDTIRSIKNGRNWAHVK